MPKGVEHGWKEKYEEQYQLVPTSLMPKGVEHYAVTHRKSTECEGANLIDAERR